MVRSLWRPNEPGLTGRKLPGLTWPAAQQISAGLD